MPTPVFTYLLQQPARYTFEQPQLKAWVESWCTGSVLNLFAGKVRLNVPEFRVDMDPTVNPDWCGDAGAFVDECVSTGRKFDTIVLDPPYNLRKAREKYGARYVGSFTVIRRKLPRILPIGGRLITLGYDSVGMGGSKGFRKVAICLVCHGGDHNDTIGLVEEMECHQETLIDDPLPTTLKDVG